MNKLTPHTDPEHRYRLPREVLAALASESDEARAQFHEIWDQADQYLGDEPDDARFRQLGAEIWPNLEAALHQEDQEEEPPATRLRLVKAPLRLITSSKVAWSAVAACIALLITVGIVYMQRPISVTAPQGAQVVHTLPDGSTLTLNSGTTIRYARSFGETARAVSLLDGEVLFDVTKDTQPFQIETFNGTVTVLGTTFSVRARPEDIEPATVVAVASGTVQLAPSAHPNNTIRIIAGQSARLGAQSPTPLALDSTDTRNALAWHTGGFMFRDHPFGTVVRELERRFDVRINVLSKSLLNEPVGLLLEDPRGPEEILSDICELNAKCQYRAVPGGYTIVDPAAE